MTTLAAGTRLGPYVVEAPIGAGGMGEVYRARDTRLDRTVAIKVLPTHVAADPEARQRFEREARAIAALNHPHICTLHDIGRESNLDFLVLEHLEGETLAERLARGPLSLAQAVRIATQVADALAKAHRLGIVHRDLKPGNIFLHSTQGSGSEAARRGDDKTVAKLLDFGLAKAAAPAGLKTRPPAEGPAKAGPHDPQDSDSRGVHLQADPTAPTTLRTPLTIQGTILGTLNYMAPEQLEGREADARSDIFAFGCVLYEMMTGKRAFEGTSPAVAFCCSKAKKAQESCRRD